MIFRCQIHGSFGNKHMKYRILLLISLSYCLLANLCFCASWPVSRKLIFKPDELYADFLCKTSNMGWEWRDFGIILADCRVYLKLCGGDLDLCLQHIDDARRSCWVCVGWIDEMGLCEVVVGIPAAGIAADTRELWHYRSEVCKRSLKDIRVNIEGPLFLLVLLH